MIRSAFAKALLSSRRNTINNCFLLRYFSSPSLKDSYEHVLVEKRLPETNANGTNGVGIITLNRPKALNALCDGLFDDLIHAARALDRDDEVGCMVLTGSPKAFAAGADISEMSQQEFVDVYSVDMFSQWQDVTKVSKPIIAAVNGFALGGGCELAMMCDIMLASDTAKFGQPEINLGVIPGAGGTQRLTRAIGKSKAMHMCLTGDFISAQEAYDAGLVAKVFPSDTLVEEAIKMGHLIASKGRVSAMMCKEAVNAADELSLQEGLRFERRLFHALFATNDQKEGMSAFLEKRPAEFTNK
eukprot:CAMPEP_0194216686 /NCGR_PEP_ID=MMETSP0156-20130528/19504_1 /TAXON_ID=33649 /ORGANISM="Thalassionema nitzschioides, Strain L26-B" /LENGTH=299 /DNA_ID=CAMNT_0038945515 /DNA_START=73 /DNA_END=972 /DNA_ORIENTATION=-